MPVIKLPKPAAGSMNKNRPVSGLLKAQVMHLREAEKKLPAHEQSGIDPETIKTEGEAAEYLRKVTARLHPQSSGS